MPLLQNEVLIGLCFCRLPLKVPSTKMADEVDFLDLLIASERVEGWLALIRDGSNASRYTQRQQTAASYAPAARGPTTHCSKMAHGPLDARCLRARARSRLLCRLKQALEELAAAVNAKEAYAEEVSPACTCGALPSADHHTGKQRYLLAWCRRGWPALCLRSLGF